MTPPSRLPIFLAMVLLPLLAGQVWSAYETMERHALQESLRKSGETCVSYDKNSIYIDKHWKPRHYPSYGGEVQYYCDPADYPPGVVAVGQL
jgi:hypothetical protein